MDLAFIIILLVVLVGVFLIFKFIKKIIFAVVSVFILFIIAIAAVFGLVYLDFKQLSSQHNFNVDVIYVNNSTYAFGTQVMVKNNSQINLSSIKGLSTQELSSINVKNISNKDNLFVVEVDSKLFKKLITNKSFTFNQFASNNAFSNLKFNFNGSQIEQILASKTPKEDFVNMLLDNNNIKGSMRTAIKPVVENEINKFPFTVRQFLFIAVMQESLKDNNNVLMLLKAYKNNQGISIYPDRLSFQILRMLPINTIENYVPKVPTLA